MTRKDHLFIIGVGVMIGGIIILVLSFLTAIYFTAIFKSVPLMRETNALKFAESIGYFIIPIGVVMFGMGGTMTFLNIKPKE